MMTISKKLSLMITLVFGVQFVTQANNINEFAHKTTIVNFTQGLHGCNIAKADIIAQWLNAKVMSNNYVSNDEITIANIINNSELTTESKITIFSQTMEKEAIDKKNEAIASIAGSALFITLLTGGLTLLYKNTHRARTVTKSISLFGREIFNRTTSTSIQFFA